MASKKYNIYELKNISAEWIDIPIEAIPEKKRAIFEKRKNAINMYINEVHHSDIYLATGIDHTHLAKMIDRCLRAIWLLLMQTI